MTTGLREGICVRCSNRIEQTISALGHQMNGIGFEVGNTDPKDGDKLVSSCTRCDHKVELIYLETTSGMSTSFAGNVSGESTGTFNGNSVNGAGVATGDITIGAKRPVQDVFIYSPEQNRIVFTPIVAIGIEAFRGNTTITSVVIGGSIVQIRSFAFFEANNIHTVEIKTGITSIIDQYAFANMASLTTINLGESIHTINTHAFANSTNITSIVIPN